MLKVSPIEEKIIDARCSGMSFSEMSDIECRCAIDQIMFRGAAISGCTLPQTEFFAEFIAEEIFVFLQEFGFSEYTYEEVILALRLNSKGDLRRSSGVEIEQVTFFGACFNVNYISKVLTNYSIIRLQLDRKFENQLDGY